MTKDSRVSLYGFAFLCFGLIGIATLAGCTNAVSTAANNKSTEANAAEQETDKAPMGSEAKSDEPQEMAKPQEQATKQQPDVKGLSEAERTKVLFQSSTRLGVKFLLEKGQADDGSFSKQLSPAVTALCTSALLQNRVPLTDARVQKALKFMEKNIKPSGGIYEAGSNLKNYETSVALMCFNLANADGKYDDTIQKGVDFLKGIQWDEGEGHNRESSFYGGQGYGSHERPDMSNTSFYEDVLAMMGEDKNSASFQNAEFFAARSQNLPGKHNTAEWARNVSEDDRGGFIYTGVGEGESKAGKTPEGGLRSYGSMTYAGLKSMLYVGVDKDDIRVKAAMDWIGRHYDLTTNPGMGQQGLFYYYHVFAKTLKVAELDAIVDSKGKSHDWRADLVAQLSSVQKEDGSWTNPADRWYEGDPNLVTAYSLLALSYCDKESDAK